MSAMAAAEPVREPEELYSIPEDLKSELLGFIEVLPLESGRKFVHQLFEALARSKHEGDLRPLNELLESWTRTWLFMTRPRFDELWDEAQRAEGPGLTLEQIQARRAARSG